MSKRNSSHAALYKVLRALPLYKTVVIKSPVYNGLPLQHKIAHHFNSQHMEKVRAIVVRDGLLFVRIK